MVDHRGLYLTLDQAAMITPITQGALFNIPLELLQTYIERKL